MAVIGIAACRSLHDYEASIRRAGGTPRVLRSETDAAAEVIHQIDALLLPGGRDVDPALYGETRHSSFGASETGRDVYEIELTRLASDMDLPIFAICRGIQVLNVARRGTLIQDIPEHVGGTLNHAVDEPPCAIAHSVAITSGTLLERLMRERLEGTVCPVNSRHHQAVHVLGHGLVVSGIAPDGVIEAVEDPTRRFCLGVQWHPENFYPTGEFLPLFEGLVRAAESER
jgi:putative glutamine amidotransferase